MRTYGIVRTSFWAWAQARGLSRAAREMALYFLASLHITIDCKAVRTRFPELIAAGFPYRRSLEHCSNRFPGLIDRQREGMPNHTHTHDHKHNHECSEADASACRDSTLQGKK